MLKIALIGPESTGKTALSKRLAEYYGVTWIPEYAREYLDGIQNDYTFHDVYNIARRQVEVETFYENQPQDCLPEFIFFDTELIITKVWFEFCYQTVPDFLTEQLAKKFIDFYLLCSPDLPWEPDPLREHGGDDRRFFYEWYLREIQHLDKPYVIIEGVGEERFQQALKAVEQFRNKSK